MPALSSITKPKIVEATIGAGDDKLTIQFDRNRVTLNWVQAVTGAYSSQDAGILAEALAAVVAGWDLTNDDGTPFPPTAQNIGELPASLLGELSSSIQQASAPGEAEGKASSVQPSTPSEDYTVQAQESQNGQDTSRSPSGSELLSPT